MSVEIRPSIPTAVSEAVLAGRRLDDAALEALAATPDILALGALADDVRRRRHGAATTFVRVHALDVSRVEQWTPPPVPAREVRLTGAATSPEALVAAVRQARRLAGTLVLRGFDLADVLAAGGVALFADLAGAGLDELATTPAGAGAAEGVRAARAAGFAVRVVGLGRPVDDRAAWLRDVRALLDAVGGIQAVAPLSRTADVTTPTTGFDDVRAVGLARLALDTVASIQVDWRAHGPKLAQVALTVGADDLDLVSADDDASRGPRRAALEDVRRNIVAAALTPVERDGRFARLG